MSIVASPFRIKRHTLEANRCTPIYPPTMAKSVSVGNATSGDLELHTHLDESEYLVIASGYERVIPLDLHLFRPEQVAFRLKAEQAGTVVILWY